MQNIVISVNIPGKGWRWVTGNTPLSIDGEPYSAAGEIAGVDFGDKLNLSVNIKGDGFRQDVQAGIGSETVIIRFWLNNQEFVPAYRGVTGLAGIRNGVWEVEIDNGIGREPERIIWSHEYQQQRYPSGDLFFSQVSSLSDKKFAWPNDNADDNVTPRDIVKTYNPIAYEPPPPTGPIPVPPAIPVDPPLGPRPVPRRHPRVVGNGIPDQIGSADLRLGRHISNALSYSAISRSDGLIITVTGERLTVSFTGNEVSNAVVTVIGYEKADRTGNAVSTKFNIRRVLLDQAIPLQTVSVDTQLVIDLDTYFSNAESYDSRMVSLRSSDSISVRGERFLAIVGMEDNGVVPARVRVRAYDRANLAGSFVEAFFDVQVVPEGTRTLLPPPPAGFNILFRTNLTHDLDMEGDPVIEVPATPVSFTTSLTHALTMTGDPVIGLRKIKDIPTQVIPVGQSVTIDMDEYFVAYTQISVTEPYEIFSYPQSGATLSTTGIYDVFHTELEDNILTITANDPNRKPAVIAVTATDGDRTVTTYFGVKVMRVGVALYSVPGVSRISGIPDHHGSDITINLESYFAGASAYTFTSDNNGVVFQESTEGVVRIRRNTSQPVLSGTSLVTITAYENANQQGESVETAFRMTWPVVVTPETTLSLPPVRG